MAGVKVTEGQVFKLPFQFPYAQAVGKGGVDFHSFLGYAAAFFSRKCLKGAHIVKAVCQFYKDHPQIFGHGHQHFTQVFSLTQAGIAAGAAGVFYAGAKCQLAQLGDPVYQFGYVCPEFFFYLLQADMGIFGDVMEQSSRQGGRVQLEVSQSYGHV
ncbi:MAG: hypothetical protein JMHAAFGB_00129 [Dehalococcoides mccartyi]|nr:hypothetical protein [Dehalococcoides mccartyi]